MEINFSKNPDGLIPAIIQDHETKNVLMLGYMNAAALEQTIATKRVTFFSRSQNKLWVKGETSGNYLDVVTIQADCDNDTLLIRVRPHGNTCHTGTATCWGDDNQQEYGLLSALETTIAERRKASAANSYVASLFSKGINKVAQKVGEEAVEMVIEALNGKEDLFLEESADLLFHYLMLLHAKGFALDDVVGVLRLRQKG